jgi:hypothetical protein
MEVKKIKEDFVVVSCMVGQMIVLTLALVSYKLIICHMLYKKPVNMFVALVVALS